MTYRWIFVAMTLIFLSIFLSLNNIWALCLLLYWLIRLLMIKDKKLLFIVGIVSLIFVVRNCKNDEESRIDETIDTAVLFIKPTTYSIDGDQLKFEGYIDQFDEMIVAHHTIPTESDKNTLKELEAIVIKVKGELKEPSENRNINQFNYKTYLKRKGIFYQFKVNELQPINEDIKLPLNIQLDYLRYKMKQFVMRIFDGPVLGYIQALIFANIDAMDIEIVDLYRSLGIIHLISISGLHIDLLINTVKGLLRTLRVSRERSLLAIIITLPIYLFIAGAGVSVFRAVVSNILQSTVKVCNIKLSKSDCWSITMIIALLINPSNIYSIGFQLSYALSGLLILLSENHTLDKYRSLTQMVIVNILVNMISIPIITYHFYEYPLSAFFINLIYVPIFSMVLFPLVVLTFFVGLLFKQMNISLFLTVLTNTIITFSEKVLHSLTSYDLLTIVPGRLTLTSYLVLTISIVIVLIKINQLKSKWLYFGIVLYLISLNSNSLSPMNYIYMIDVGQGDSVMIKAPFSNKAVLIDTGGQFSWTKKEPWQERKKKYTLAENEIIPTLKSFGINEIERLYLTHGDFDHVGELGNLIKLIPIKEIVATESALNSELLKPLVTQSKKIYKAANVPSIEQYKSIDLALLHPIKADEDSNDTSLVIYTKIGENGWLFTGDLEETGEQILMKQYPKMSVDILKVGHHGSRTSSSEIFIDFYNPKTALISVGENNRYNHPNNEVIERLERQGTVIYRTDEDGGVLYRYSHYEIINRLFNPFITVK